MKIFSEIFLQNWPNKQVSSLLGEHAHIFQRESQPPQLLSCHVKELFILKFYIFYQAKEHTHKKEIINSNVKR